MLDIRLFRDTPSDIDAQLARRGVEGRSEVVLELDRKLRTLQTDMQNMQARRNSLSKDIGQAKASGDQELADKLMAEVADMKVSLPQKETQEKQLQETMKKLLYEIPNLPAKDVPTGCNEEDNVEVRRWGKPSTADGALEHFEIGADLGMDFEAASKMSGSRFVLLRGSLAKLERALATFMLDLHINDHGYHEIAPPFLVRDDSLYGTGQLPKFADDLFRTDTGHWLIPTAEVPLTNLVADSIIDSEELPLRFTSYTPCFRSEAGTAGQDTRGMIRQHQFSKVELVSITTAEQAVDEHERMTDCAETVLKKLGLPFRTMLLCTGDMGFAAEKTYDLEVWLPGQGRYREISSCSRCSSFQARRMNARHRPKAGVRTEYVHTLNGSALAVGRCLIAVVENYQQADGSVAIPPALQPYMGGVTSLDPDPTS